MKRTRYLVLASLASLWLWNSPSMADPDLLAGGDLRNRESGIKVGHPRVRTPQPQRTIAPIEQTPPPHTTVKDPPVHDPGVSMNPTNPPLPLGVPSTQHGLDVLNKLTSQGLGTRFTGVGKVAGEMVEIDASNGSQQRMDFRLMPGMVLEAPAGSNVQPLVLEDDIPVTLNPGEHFVKRLNAYCLDYKVDPPEKGRVIDYRFASRIDPTWTNPVKVLLAGLKLDGSGQMTALLKPSQHRRVVIQHAIWEVLGQRQDEAALKQAVHNNHLTKRTENKIVNGVRHDMDKVLSESKNVP